MKKSLILLIVVILGSMPVFSQVNMPGEPVYDVAPVSNNSPSSVYKKDLPSDVNGNIFTRQQKPMMPESFDVVDDTKARLDSLALSALKAAEARNDGLLNSYVRKMMESGAEGFSNPQIISKKTPTCPPIKIKVNGREVSGSRCSLMGYLYKGKQYDVGYCR